jgi:hypothetical protein
VRVMQLMRGTAHGDTKGGAGGTGFVHGA